LLHELSAIRTAENSPEIGDSCWQQFSACVRAIDFGGSTAQDWASIGSDQRIAVEGSLRIGRATPGAEALATNQPSKVEADLS